MGKGVIQRITPRILPFPPDGKKEEREKYDQQKICQFHFLAFSHA